MSTGQSIGKASHTPGPWEVRQGAHCEAVYSVPLFREVTLSDGTRSHEGLVALVYGHHDANGAFSQEANHRLIAAAPDLLALAKQYAAECARCGGSAEIVVNDHGDDPEFEYCQPCNECEDIRKVIAKAEGTK